MNRQIRRLAQILALLVLAGSVAAVPLEDKIVEQLKQSGQFNAFLQNMAEARARGVDVPSTFTLRSAARRGDAAAPMAEETLKVLTIMVDFSDQPWASGRCAASAHMIDSMLFSQGVGAIGSLTDFYLENSYGSLLVQGTVVGWYRADHPSTYYTNNCDGSHGMGPYPYNSQSLAEEAVAQADADVNYADFDNNHDGTVEAMFIVHSGLGYENTGNGCLIHSHAWSFSRQRRDGVWVSRYSIQPEEAPYSDPMVQIGVFCHEFGHQLGLPDLYDTDYSSEGVGNWSVMSGGSYNGTTKRPAQFDAWCKKQLGWIPVTTLTSTQIALGIPAIEYNQTAYRFWPGGSTGPEYFLVENRQKRRFDTSLPGAGLLIWHINENVSGNENENLPLVALEQADGKFHLQKNTNGGDASDPYPGGGNVRGFDTWTTPNTKSYYDTLTNNQLGVYNISNSDSMMTADIRFEFGTPAYNLDSLTFKDPNGSGFLESYEQIEMAFFLRNDGDATHHTTISGSCKNSRVMFSRTSSTYATVPGNGGTLNNKSWAFLFTVPFLRDAEFDTFYVTIQSDGGYSTNTFAVEQVLGPTRVLLVDDDRGAAYDTVFTNDLRSWGVPYGYWSKLNQGSPDSAALSKYGVVIWFTGDYADNLLSATDLASMKGYLTQGGHLFLTGQGLAGQLSAQDPTFLNDYLKCQLGSAYYNQGQTGATGSSISAGMTIRYRDGSNQLPEHSSEIVPQGTAAPVFTFAGGTNPSALSYDGGYKLVFFNWGFEGLSPHESGYTDRDVLLSRILLFLDAWVQPPCNDTDGDGYGAPGDPKSLCAVDNCPSVANADQTDSDHDGIGDACCCTGTTADVNLSGLVDLVDLSTLVLYCTGGTVNLRCPNEANVNGVGIVDLSDLSSLVNYLTGGGYTLPSCPSATK